MPPPDGTFTLTTPLITVLATANAPLEVPRKDELPSEATLEVHIRMPTGSGTPQTRHLEHILHRALRTVLLTALLPRTLIQLTLQILHLAPPPPRLLPGHLRSPHVHLFAPLACAAYVALLRARVPLDGVLTGVVLGRARRGKKRRGTRTGTSTGTGTGGEAVTLWVPGGEKKKKKKKEKKQGRLGSVGHGVEADAVVAVVLKGVEIVGVEAIGEFTEGEYDGWMRLAKEIAKRGGGLDEDATEEMELEGRRGVGRWVERVLEEEEEKES